MTAGSAAPSERALLAWSVAGEALEDVSGDLHAVVPFDGGTLVAVIDGLGHGPEAAAAARAAGEIVAALASRPVREVIERCHDGIRASRGVVMSLVSLDARTSSLTWMGVGNVEAMLLRADPMSGRSYDAIRSRGGVVGHRLPPLDPATLPVATGDLLVMATDGIRAGFGSTVDRTEPDLQVIADRLLEQHGKGTDDALVLVARLFGREVAATGGTA